MEDAYFEELKEYPTLNAIFGELERFSMDSKAANFSFKEINSESREKLKIVKTDAAARIAVSEFTDAPDQLLSERSRNLLPLIEKFRSQNSDFLDEDLVVVKNVIGRIVQYKSRLSLDSKLKSSRTSDNCGGACNTAFYYAQQDCAAGLITDVALSFMGSYGNIYVGAGLILISGAYYYYCDYQAIDGLGRCFDACNG